MAENIWVSRPVKPGKTERWGVGPLHIWYKALADELWIAHRYLPVEEESDPSNTREERAQLPEVPEDELEWRRWTVKKKASKIQFQPVLPELPVVVKPEYPFRVNPEVRTKIYVRIPLAVRLTVQGTVIAEIPVIELSKTWFGSFVDGELAYWLTTAARKELEQGVYRPFLAISPIHIFNHSHAELLVEKICHRVGRLALYDADGHLWTNETRVRYRGPNDISEIDFSPKAPPEVGIAKLIMPPREGSKRGISAKTFDSIVDWATLGFLNR